MFISSKACNTLLSDLPHILKSPFSFPCSQNVCTLCLYLSCYFCLIFCFVFSPLSQFNIACVCTVWYNLRSHVLEKNWLSHPTTSITNSSSANSGTFWASLWSILEFWLAWFCAGGIYSIAKLLVLFIII